MRRRSPFCVLCSICLFVCLFCFLLLLSSLVTIFGGVVVVEVGSSSRRNRNRNFRQVCLFVLLCIRNHPLTRVPPLSGLALRSVGYTVLLFPFRSAHFPCGTGFSPCAIFQHLWELFVIQSQARCACGTFVAPWCARTTSSARTR